MKILCKSNNISASSLVNKIGKYLKKNLDGAFKYGTSSNMCDVYTTLLYQLKPEFGGKVNDVEEMTIDINITTYQNKIRVNTIEIAPAQRTLGFDLFEPEQLLDLAKAKDLILKKVIRRIQKAYEDYLILY